MEDKLQKTLMEQIQEAYAADASGMREALDQRGLMLSIVALTPGSTTIIPFHPSGGQAGKRKTAVDMIAEQALRGAFEAYLNDYKGAAGVWLADEYFAASAEKAKRKAHAQQLSGLLEYIAANGEPGDDDAGGSGPH